MRYRGVGDGGCYCIAYGVIVHYLGHGGGLVNVSHRNVARHWYCNIRNRGGRSSATVGRTDCRKAVG